jgi:hypothetical protein
MGIQLGTQRHRSYICYDLHLESYSSEARARVFWSIREPIHVMTRRGDILIARRAPKCGSKVAHFLEKFGKHDHMRRPFFHDDENPSLSSNGRYSGNPRSKAAKENPEKHDEEPDDEEEWEDDE